MGSDLPPAVCRPALVDVIDGYYVASIVDFLHREGILRALAAGEDAGSIACLRGFDPGLLLGLLEFVALRSDLLDRNADGRNLGFKVAPGYCESPMPAHLIDQYLGGFAPCLRDLAAILRDPQNARRLVDGRRHADAFSHDAVGGSMLELVQIIEAFGIRILLDIGCGGGHLLTELAQRIVEFSGIGIDANPEIVAVARQRIAKGGLADRIEILLGDVFNMRLAEKQQFAVDAIAATGVANAFFGNTPGENIDDFLRLLRRLFPNRLIFVCDYYGRLGTTPGDAELFKHTLIHDVAQLVSGQGVPPGDLQGWRDIYARSSCEIVQAFEGQSAGVAWFIHVVQL